MREPMNDVVARKSMVQERIDAFTQIFAHQIWNSRGEHDLESGILQPPAHHLFGIGKNIERDATTRGAGKPSARALPLSNTAAVPSANNPEAIKYRVSFRGGRMSVMSATRHYDLSSWRF
jgi:hypothetical protein